jgi:hypothetical protein
MPSLLWEPRTFDNQEVVGNAQAWDGYGYLRDADRMVKVPSYRLFNGVGAPAVGYTLQAAVNRSSPIWAAKNGAGTWKLFEADASSLGSEITLPGAETFPNPLVAAKYSLTVTLLGHTGGLGFVDHAANTYTLITSSVTSPKWICVHLTRALAIDNGNNTIYWCQPGDITDWTTAADGAGSVFLNDASSLVALFVINGIVVAVGSSTIHYGYPTGTANPAYRWERRIFDTDICDTVGVPIVQHEDQLYMKGKRGFYKFEDGVLTDIGAGAWRNIKGTNNTRPYHAIVTDRLNGASESSSEWPRKADTRCMFVPFKPSATAIATSQIFSYNIDAQSWEAFYSGIAANADWSSVYNVEYPLGIPHFMGYQTNNINYFTTSANGDDQLHSIESAPLVMENPDRDYTVSRVLVTYVDVGELLCNLTVYAVLNNSEINVTTSFTLGTAGATGKTLRVWVHPGRITGQLFRVKISGSVSGTTTTLGVIKNVALISTDAGEFRGV